jgi:hypothetical protein
MNLAGMVQYALIVYATLLWPIKSVASAVGVPLLIALTRVNAPFLPDQSVSSWRLYASSSLRAAKRTGRFQWEHA